MKNIKAILIAIFFLTISNSQTIGKAIITFAGDLMIDKKIYDNFIKQRGWWYPFQNIYYITRDSDFGICNLESPLSNEGKPYKKKYIFYQSLAVLKGLKLSGIKAVSLANNHIMDYGPSGLKDTINLLKIFKIRFFGAGNNIEKARKPLRVNIKGIDFSILGYSNVYPKDFFSNLIKPGTAPAYLYYLKEDIEREKKNSDIVIVFIHWGREYFPYPTSNQRFLAHRIIDYGADIVIGQHTHNPQPIEIYKNSIIFYSLGNFVFTTPEERARYSIIVKGIFFNEDLFSFLIIPILVNNKIVEFSPRILPIKESEKFLKKLAKTSKKLNTAIDIEYGIGHIFIER